jgi:hypothetical protein
LTVFLPLPFFTRALSGGNTFARWIHRIRGRTAGIAEFPEK